MSTKIINFIVFLLLLAGTTTVYAGNDIPISAEQLPEKAKVLLTSYFPDVEISYVKMEKELFSRSYDVFLIDGSKLEFDRQGQWTEVKRRHDPVPSAIIPEGINQFVKEKHVSFYIIQIEQDKRGYEVKLNNGLEIIFDRRSRFIKYDD